MSTKRNPTKSLEDSIGRQVFRGALRGLAIGLGIQPLLGLVALIHYW